MNFGFELVVVFMLFVFFENIFGLSKVMVGIIVVSYVFMNLVFCFGGGLIFDKLGSCKLIMIILIVGMAIGYLMMGNVKGGWWLFGVVLLIMLCFFFV